MNAVHFFVQAVVDYGNIFQSLHELFSRICDVLERFAIYLDKQNVIDLAMKRIANELLLTFVKICELSCKVLHRNRALQFIKTLAFQDNAGVKEQLEKLARLIERETQLRGTLNYVSSKTTEKNIVTGFSQTLEGIGDAKGLAAQSLKAIKRLETNNDLKKQLEEVREALGEPEYTYKSKFRDCVNTAVPGTGEWLHQEPSFMKWIKPDTNDEPILVFSGNEGYGKTYLMSAVVQYLQKQYPQGKEDITRVSIAYYYFKLDQEAKGWLSSPKSRLTVYR